MKLGIMQPYFFPYIGHWQLLNTVDQYVIYDDVSFIKGGWIHRNRILLNGQPEYFNLSMSGASSNKRINQIGINLNPQWVAKKLRTITAAYHKAPFFSEVYPLIETALTCKKSCISDFLLESYHLVCHYLNIHTTLLLSSSLPKDCTLKGQDKILSICRLLHASEYYNAIGGYSLYSFADFEKQGIRLFFLEPDEIRYQQFDAPFQPNLSIIDVMMFNSRETIRHFLNAYTLVTNEGRVTL